MRLSRINKIKRLSTLPPEWSQDLLPEIQALIQNSRRKVVVLDDDPTGTQTVYDLPVITEWSVPVLQAELTSNYPGFYILTNSRSLTARNAQMLNREIGANLNTAVKKTGVLIEVISRSDSTLRGHFPEEVDALAQSMELDAPPYLLVPFFLEGGRYTLDDVHYVAEGEQLIPAGDTPYARDAAFGYKSSNLREWVEEKTNGKIPAACVTSISLKNLREAGPQRVKEVLIRLKPGSVCIVNAASYRDLEVFVTGLLRAEAEGLTYLLRTAASFVRVRVGLAPRPLLTPEELSTGNDHGGLFVVGSYVPKTTAQLQTLLEHTGIFGIEINASNLLNHNTQAREVTQAIQQANKNIQAGQDVVIYTSRELVSGIDTQANLSIGQHISDRLISIVRGIEFQPRYFVAKGGITSSDVATKGLGVRRAIVLGQMLPGVPVWKLGVESRYPGMPYIVFPGNVGEVDALVQIWQRLAK